MNNSTLGVTVGRILTGLGALLMALGTGFSYWLEIHSFKSTSDRLFTFLATAFWLTPLVGALLAVVGGSMWAWRTESRKLLICGVGLIIGSWAAPYVIGIDVHNWSVALLIPILCGMLLGVMSLAILPVRHVLRRKTPPSTEGR